MRRLLLVNLISVVLCGPYKYPYIFLLDIGNVELKATASEQVRLKVDGGSVALRYPAEGDGDIISHVRVTGVDFGANLVATVVDGGPGCEYVVLAVAEKNKMPYEVVFTFDTIKEPTDDETIIRDVNGNYNSINEEVAINSDEDKADSMSEIDPKSNGNGNNNIEYGSLINEETINEELPNLNTQEDDVNTIEDNNDNAQSENLNPIRLLRYQQYFKDDENLLNPQNKFKSFSERNYPVTHPFNDENKERSSYQHNENDEIQQINTQAESSLENERMRPVEYMPNEDNARRLRNQEYPRDEANAIYNQEELPPDNERNEQVEYNLNEDSVNEKSFLEPKAEPYSFESSDYQTDEEKSQGFVDKNLYDKYKELRPHLAEDVQVYTSPNNVETGYDDLEEFNQMFNDEEVHNFPVNPKDPENFSDDDTAVAY